MILAIKTSDDTAQLWLYQPGSVDVPVAQSSWESGRALADQLLHRLSEFITARAGGPDFLTGIIIFSGPGSFTSLRIGHTVANSLADSLGIPIAGSGGQHWRRDAMTALEAAKSGTFALPLYGAEANISTPKT